MKIPLIIALIIALLVAVPSQISSSATGSCGIRGADLHWKFGAPITYAEANLKSNEKADCTYNKISVFEIQRMEKASVKVNYAMLLANAISVSVFYFLLLLPLLSILGKVGIKKALIICGASTFWFALGGSVSFGLVLGTAFGGGRLGIGGWLILLTVGFPATLAYLVTHTFKLPGLLILGWAIATYIVLGIRQFLALQKESG